MRCDTYGNDLLSSPYHIMDKRHAEPIQREDCCFGVRCSECVCEFFAHNKSASMSAGDSSARVGDDEKCFWKKIKFKWLRRRIIIDLIAFASRREHSWKYTSHQSKRYVTVTVSSVIYVSVHFRYTHMYPMHLTLSKTKFVVNFEVNYTCMPSICIGSVENIYVYKSAEANGCVCVCARVHFLRCCQIQIADGCTTAEKCRHKTNKKMNKYKFRQNKLANWESHVTAQMPNERWHLFIYFHRLVYIGYWQPLSSVNKL